MVSLRDASTADVIEAIDLTTFLTILPCNNCVRLDKIELTTDSDLAVYISIKHPFPMGDPGKPIKATNRADLLGYNIEGIVVGDGPATSNALGVRYPNTLLKNADGYTGYLNTSLQTIFPTTSTIHPYKLHFDDFSAGNYNPTTYPATGFPPAPTLATGNLVMSQGADFNQQEYIFDLQGTTALNFVFAIGATYGINTAGKSTWMAPQARVPQHNKKAASQVEVEVFQNNLYPGVPASSAVLHIKVLDMNHGATIGTAINNIRSASNVSEISVMVPNMMTAPVINTSPVPVSGSPRDPVNPLNYSVTITNSASGSVGTYYGLVKVKDNYAPNQNTPPLTDGMSRVGPGKPPSDGFFTIPEFATYQTFAINITTTCGPITGSIVSGCPTEGVPTDTMLDFVVTAATAGTGGSITLYEIDWDYNGTTFVPDPNYAGNTDGIFNGVGPFVNPACPAETPPPESYTVAFRALDECDPPIPTIFATCVVVVDECEPGTYFYDVDPAREGLDISDPSLDWPVDPTDELDIAVCENSSISDIDGVYMFEGTYNAIARFDLDYTNSVLQAPAWLPWNNVEPPSHPNPDDPMPGLRLDITQSGYLVSCYYDINETLDLSSIDPALTDPFAEGLFFYWYEPTLPRPATVPPSGTDPWPHELFCLQYTTDTAEVTEDPLAWETWDESTHVTVSSPYDGSEPGDPTPDPQGTTPYPQPDNSFGTCFRYSEPTLMDPIYGYTIVYFGYEPPYYDGTSFHNLFHYAWDNPFLPGQELKGMDRSDRDWLYIAMNGPLTALAYTTTTEAVMFAMDVNDYGGGWYMDVNEALNAVWPDVYPIIPTGDILDVECIPYDSTDPIIFDYWDDVNLVWVPAPQFAAVAAILHENKHIYLISYYEDPDPLNNAVVFIQDIDGSTTIPGTVKHLDVGEETGDIHVSSTDGTTAYSTVFKLTMRP
jgi:hypothetical protein